MRNLFRAFGNVRHHAKHGAKIAAHGFVAIHLVYLASIARDIRGVRSVTELLVCAAVICEHIGKEG